MNTFKVSFHVRHCLILPFSVSNPTVGFIRVPIGSSSSLCYNERILWNRDGKTVWSGEKQQSFSLSLYSVLIRALLSKARSEHPQTSCFVTPGHVLKWLLHNTIERYLWLCLMSHFPILFMLRIRVVSLSTSSSSLLLSVWKFPRSSPPASTQTAA